MIVFYTLMNPVHAGIHRTFFVMSGFTTWRWEILTSQVSTWLH